MGRAVSAMTDEERTWWVRAVEDEEDPRAHEKLTKVVNLIERDQPRKRDFLLWGAMYSGGTPPAGGGMAVDSYVRTTPGSRSNLALNVGRTVVDSVASKLFSKSMPRLTYVTEGGGFEKQDNAKKLELGIAGAFSRTDANKKFVTAGKDGLRLGTGFVKIHPGYRLDVDWTDKEVLVERWMPWEVLFDLCELPCGAPRNLYTARYWDKDVLRHLFQDDEYKVDKIRTAPVDHDEDTELGFTTIARRLRVYEAWHRPAGKGATDGRHVMATHECTLLDEPWDGGPPDRPWLFEWWSWTDGLLDIYGQGIIELGAGIQAEINKLVREIQNGHHLIKGHWLVEQNSKVMTSHINNDLSTIIRYAGVEPKYIAPAIISPEVYSHLWQLVSQYYEIVRVNKQAATAEKPQGLDSGEAQRVYRDMQAETLLDQGQRYDEFVRRCGQLTVDAARMLAKHGGGYVVRAEADDGFETIDWAKVDDPDDYQLRVAMTSSLPSTPSGKISLGNDLMQLGDIDAADMMEIIGMPDILQKTRLKQSSRKLVEKRVGEMLRDGVMWHPHPLLNLAEAKAIATDMCNMAEEKGVAEENLELVRVFVSECDKPPWLPEEAPAPAGPQAIAPGAPMLGPGQAGGLMAPKGTPGPPMNGAPPGPPMNGAPNG
jgi:hypothetical protein